MRRAIFAICLLLAACGTDIYPEAVSTRSAEPAPPAAVSPALDAPLSAVSRWRATELWHATEHWIGVVSASHTPTPPAPRPPRHTMAVRSSGSCGGWYDLIASLWPAEQVGTACRVMMCESGGNPSARNPSGAIGLFQLLGHGGTTDPVQNATVAYRLWSSSGWSPWVCR